MTINKVYVITHPFYAQENRLPKNQRAEWVEQRLKDVLELIEKVGSDLNAYLVFYCTGLEPNQLSVRLKKMDQSRSHIFRGPNNYLLNADKDKKLGAQSFEKEIKLYTFGAFREACINETTRTITDYLKNKTKVIGVVDLGSDSLHKLYMGKKKTQEYIKKVFGDISQMIKGLADFYFSIFRQINTLLNEEEEETKSSEEDVANQEEKMRKNEEHGAKIKAFEEGMEKFISHLSEKEKSFESNSGSINNDVFLKELEFLFSAILDADDKMGNFFDYIGSVKPELQKEIFNLISSASMDYAKFIDKLKILQNFVKNKKANISELLKELEDLKNLSK